MELGHIWEQVTRVDLTAASTASSKGEQDWSRIRQTVCRLSGLASWWLFDKWCKRYPGFGDRPALPDDSGFCPILLVMKDRQPNCVVRPSVVCPVRWVRQRAGDDESQTRLPQLLTDLAEKIRDQLQQEGLVGLDQKNTSREVREKWENLNQWRLIPGIEYFPDLSALNGFFKWDSATLPLAASLLLTAIDEKRPNPAVFGSGVWSEGELQEVTGYREKAACIAEWGGRYFFLPENNLDENEKIDIEKEYKIKIVPVSRQYRTLLDTVRTYRSSLEGEPPENAGADEIQSYYMRIPREIDNRHFYRKRIKPILVAGLRDQNVEYDRLVSWVSYGSELIEVGAEVFRPKRITLFYTDTFRQNMEETLKELNDFANGGSDNGNTTGKIEKKKIDGPLSRKELSKKVQEVFAGFESTEHVLIDLTLGSVPMTMAFYENAPPNATFLCWLKENDGRTNRVRPLTTTPELWQRKDKIHGN